MSSVNIQEIYQEEENEESTSMVSCSSEISIKLVEQYLSIEINSIVSIDTKLGYSSFTSKTISVTWYNNGEP